MIFGDYVDLGACAPRKEVLGGNIQKALGEPKGGPGELRRTLGGPQNSPRRESPMKAQDGLVHLAPESKYDPYNNHITII